MTGNLRKFAPKAYEAARLGRGGIIHFEVSPKNINKVVQATETVVGDVRTNLLALLPHVRRAERAEWHATIADWKARFPFGYEPAGADGALKPQRVVEELYAAVVEAGAEHRTIITTGVGQHQMFAAQYFRWRRPRSFVTSGGAGTMGFGLPAAIGAKLARPSALVVDVDGDGSFLMTGLEMVTAVQYRVGARVLLLNNNFQGMVRQWQDLFYDGRYSGTPMVNPDFAELARAMGARGMTVTTEAALPAVMRDFLFGGPPDQPALLNAVCEADEHVYPMVPAGHGLDECIVSRQRRPGAA